jgi:hypothetical protein
LENVQVGLAYESRVPDVDDAVDRLVDVVNHEGRKQRDHVACNDVKIHVIQRNLDRPGVAVWELGDGLDDVSEVSGGYMVSSVLRMDKLPPHQARTGKQELQRPTIAFALVRAELKNIKSGNVAPEVLLPPKLHSRPPPHKARVSILQNPVGLPCWLCQRRLAIGLVNGPVGLLAVRAAILEKLRVRKCTLR